MKKIADFITIGVFFTIIVMFGVSTLVFQTKSDVNEQIKENGVQKGISVHLKNNYPLKKNLDSLYARILKMTGKKEFDNICIVNDNRLVQVKSYDKNTIKKNTQILNDFSEKSGVPAYVMISPTAAGIYYSDPLNQNQKSTQKEIINNIYLGLDTDIAAVDAFGALYASREDYIFYNTDKSWSSLGAYKVYLETAKKLGFEPQTMINYDMEYADNNFRGDLYEKLPYGKISSDKINLFRSKYESNIESVTLSDGRNTLKSNSVYFKDALRTQKKTDVFLEGDNYKKITIKTKLKDAPKLLVLKGSYANMLAVLLTPHYSEITLVDVNALSNENKKLKDEINVSDYDQILTATDIDSFSENEVFKCLE